MSKKKGPWKQLTSNTVYKNPWIVVKEDKVIRPDGKEGIFSTVQIKPGISILPVDSENNVYLIEEYRYAINRKTYEAPSGGIESGESVFEAAKRELREEAGLVAETITHLGTVDPFTNIVNCPNHILLAKNLEEVGNDPEGTEELRVVKMPFDHALQLYKEGEITHAATIIALLLYSQKKTKKRSWFD